MRLLILYLGLSLFVVFTAFGQRELDSMKTLLKSPIDTVKIDALFGIYEYYSMSHPQIALKYADQALAISRKIGNKFKQATALLNIGIIHVDLGNYKLAKSNFEDAVLIAKELKNLNLLARAYGNTGAAYLGLEDYEKALENYNTTLHIFEKTNDKNGLANVYGNLGNLYFTMSWDSINTDLDKSFHNFQKSRDLFSQLKNDMGVAIAHMNMGVVLINKKQYEKALELLMMAKPVFEKNNSILYEAQCISSIGNCYSGIKEYEKAMYYHKVALDKFKSIDAQDGLAILYFDIAKVFLAQKKYQITISYLEKSLALAKDLELSNIVSDCLGMLCVAYDSLNDYKQAFFYKSEQLKYIQIIENVAKTTRTEKFLAEFETKQKELLIEKKETEIRKQQLYMIFLITAIGLVFIILVILINRYKIKQKANKSLEIKNTQILQQNQEILFQRDKIEIQNNEIIKKHEEVLLQKKDITDSIIYAKRIQTALLPTNEKTMYVLQDGFCFFKPRDIVSGDFYWVEQIDDYSIIIAADCTGHGVPGAFMSIIGMNFLDEIIVGKKQMNAAEILNMLRKMIVDALSQSANLSETKDGMDIALCVLNRKTLNMQFAGAYNPVYIIKQFDNLEMNQFENGTASSNLQIDTFSNQLIEPVSEHEVTEQSRNVELVELKGDKMPIGYSDKMHLPFTLNEIKLNKGDIVYLFSDGYVDQFGGSDITTGGKKFRAKQLKQLLLMNCQQSMDNQKVILEKSIETWRGSLDQIDDLLVLGFRV